MKKKETIKEKLKSKISDKKSKWIDDAKYYEENEAWLEKSARIALKILRHLRINKISQIQLAENLSVSPQYISKILKGNENLSLETICKIEKALGINIIEVVSFESKIEISNDSTKNYKRILKADTTNIIKGKTTVYGAYQNYNANNNALKVA